MQSEHLQEIWNEASVKFKKGLYASCRESLISAIEQLDTHPLNLTLVPLLNNNKLVSQFHEDLVLGTKQYDIHEYEDIYAALKGKIVDSLSHKVAIAVVAYNCALMRSTRDHASALEILEESLLACRIELAFMGGKAEPEAKKRKRDAPNMLHVNPLGVWEVIDYILANIPRALLHEDETPNNNQSPCGTVCVFFNVVVKTLQLYAWLNVEKHSSREHCMKILSSLVDIVATNHTSSLLCKKYSEDNYITYFIMAIGAILDGEHDNTLKYLEKCLEERKDYYPAIYLKAQREYEIGNFEAAKTLFRACSVDQNYRTSDALNMEGACLLKMDKPQAALKKFQQAITIEESSIEPIFNVSAVYRATAQPNLEFEMLNFINKGMKLLKDKDGSPGNIELAVDSRKKKSDLYASDLSPLVQKYMMANIASRSGNYRFATTSYTELLSKLKTTKEDLGVASASKIKSELVYVLLEQKNYQKALDICDSILETNPSNPQALVYKADALHATGKLTEALKVIDRAIALLKAHKNVEKKEQVTSVSSNPLSPEDTNRLLGQCYDNKAVILIHLSRDAEALKALQLSIQINPRKPKTCYLCTLALIKVGKYMDACILWMDHRGIPTTLSKEDLLKLLSTRQHEAKEDKLQLLDKTIVTKYFIPEIGKQTKWT